MDNSTAKTERRDRITAALKYACRFIPALILAVLMIIALTDVHFVLSDTGTSGAKSYDPTYLILMIVMLGLSVIVPLLGDGVAKYIAGGAAFAGFPFVCFYLLEYYSRNPFRESPVMKQDIVMLNVILFYLLAVTLLFLTTRSDVALAVTAAVPMIFGFANYLAVAFRDAPVFPWDVLSLGTAMSVLDNYRIEMTSKLWFIIFTYVFMIGFAFLTGFRFRMKKKLIWVNIVAAVVALSSFIGFMAYARSDEAENRYGYYPYLFSSKYLYKYNGTALSFVWTTKYLKLNAPKGYSTDELRALYEKYKEPKQPEQDIKPNIIVIMNEAFSDLSVLAKEGKFSTNQDYLPFIHAAQRNPEMYKFFRTGSVYVSVKGGNTPNSEFEFLTGTSMAYLPTGSIPFQQYINSSQLSIVSQLKEAGYDTTAMHPYPGSGWERDEVYPRLGFDGMYFYSDFKGAERVRSYVSDSGMYKKLISLYEEKRASGDTDPQFFFGVTMQNHGSYKKVSVFTPDVTVDGLNINSSSTYYELASYLSLIKRSDEALSELINYFNSIDEPTIILMFGDHQPNDYVVRPILSMNGIKDISAEDLETQQLRWQTPYIVWANYGVAGENEHFVTTTSLNYLGMMLMKTAGITLTPFQNWQLTELLPNYPVINANCYVTSDLVFHSVKDIYSEDMLSLYAKLQYNLLFDKKNTVTGLFSLKNQ